MGKYKIQTTASAEASRFSDDKGGVIERGPTPEGNDFDVRMQDEADEHKAAEKVAKVMKQRGVCLIEANAPQELLMAAYEEAIDLWDHKEFSQPLRVNDDRSMMEARLWNIPLRDEEKVVWVKDSQNSAVHTKSALKMLASNIADFAAGLSDAVKRETNVKYDRHGHVMLSCYTGDKSYGLHIDNAHASSEQGQPDNGMRATLVYYINPYWDPDGDDDCGGLDIYLTDAKKAPSSASAARSARKLRVAPHADTLAVFLSERMAHQVIATKGKDSKVFCLTLWCLNSKAMEAMPDKLRELQRKQAAGSDDEDD